MDPLMLMELMLMYRVVTNVGRMAALIEQIGRSSHQVCISFDHVLDRMSQAAISINQSDLIAKSEYVTRNLVESLVSATLKMLLNVTSGFRCILKGISFLGIGTALDSIDFEIDGLISKVTSMVGEGMEVVFNSMDYTPLTFTSEPIPALCDQHSIEEAIKAVYNKVRYMQLWFMLVFLATTFFCCMGLAILEWKKLRAKNGFTKANRCLVMAILSFISLLFQRKAVSIILQASLQDFSSYAANVESNISPRLNYVVNNLVTQGETLWNWFINNWPLKLNGLIEEIYHELQGLLEGTLSIILECLYLRKFTVTRRFSFKVIDSLLDGIKAMAWKQRAHVDHWQTHLMILLDPTPLIKAELAELEASLITESFITSSTFLIAYFANFEVDILGTTTHLINNLKVWIKSNPSNKLRIPAPSLLHQTSRFDWLRTTSNSNLPTPEIVELAHQCLKEIQSKSTPQPLPHLPK
ncbi:hypothetical protein L0F63_003469 [Massospora cicadina]|nr:hypothetical protein L0F63_003469 [Massospora cicadina]